jgi:hypothetical protein
MKGFCIDFEMGVELQWYRISDSPEIGAVNLWFIFASISRQVQRK